MGTIVLLNSSNWFQEFLTALKEKFLEAIQIGDIGEEISTAILPKNQYILLGNKNFLLPDAVLVTWIAVGILCLLFAWIARKRDRIPSGRQLISESLVNLLLSLCKNSGMTDKQAEQVTPFVGTVGLFIVACNLVTIFKIPPPAKNIAFPVALALTTMGYVIVTGIRFVGIKGFWASLLNPMPAMLPFRILDYLIKPVSLSLRLFGNVFGAFILMEFISIIIPAGVPGLFGLWFDIADGILQAIIFSYLTITYIGEIIEGAESAHENKQGQISGKAA
mgnify:CR=1 FL=1